MPAAKVTFSNRTYTFGRRWDAVRVTLSEAPASETFGLKTWIASEVLAQHLHVHWRTRYRQSTSVTTRVLELGAGTGLPGLLLAQLGSEVVLTDAAEEPEVLGNLRGLIEPKNNSTPTKNTFVPRVEALTWGRLDEHALNLANERFHLILGADVLYAKAKDFDKLFATVRLLLLKGEEYCCEKDCKSKNETEKQKPVFLTAYKHRASHRSIESVLVSQKLQVRKGWRYPAKKGVTVDVVEIVLSRPC